MLYGLNIFIGRLIFMKKSTVKTQTMLTKNNQLAMVNPNVAGIDVGAKSIFVCAGHSDGSQEVREFSTFTVDLKSMVTWLQKLGVKSVAMESTGVYWIPSYDLLAEAGLEVFLVNPRTIKAINRKKTDVEDCQWIQQLHSYGLLKGSFRPGDDGVTFRGYVRQRQRLTQDSSIQIQLMHKSLAQMNVQLNQVLSDIAGTTGLDIIRAIVAGERDPQKLAKLRHVNCRRKEADIAKALEGNYRSELVFALKQALEAYEFFQKQIALCDQKIKEFLKDDNDNTPGSSDGLEDHEKMAAELERILDVDLTKIPGLETRLLLQIIAEIGTDMGKWQSKKHFTAWLGLCPNNKISGGKILDSRTSRITNKAAQAFRMAANTLYRSKSFVGAYLRRMRSRIGTAKAITATAHKLARILYIMISEKKQFVEYGQDAYERQYKERALAKVKRKAAEFGYELVQVKCA